MNLSKNGFVALIKKIRPKFNQTAENSRHRYWATTLTKFIVLPGTAVRIVRIWMITWFDHVVIRMDLNSRKWIELVIVSLLSTIK